MSFAAMLSAGLPAQAQQEDLRRQVDQAFRAVLLQPGNLDVSYRYAQALISAGNFEGGIAALERMLLDPKASPALRVELAVLYFRLESYDMAASYAQAALADNRLDPALQETARQIARESVSRTAPSQFRASLMIGLRAQSNATAGTSSGTILSAGTAVARPAGTGPQSGFDAVVSGNLEHVWDFGRQDGLSLVSTGLIYGSKYTNAAAYNTRAGKTDPQDLLLAEGTTGLRFVLPSAEATTWTVRPYALLGTSLLNGSQYFTSYGGGLETAYRFDQGRWVVEGGYEARFSDYATRADVREGSQQSGVDHILRGRLTRELAPGHLVSLDISGRDRVTGRDYYDFTGADFRASYYTVYGNPFGWDGQSWTTGFYAGLGMRTYGGPDRAVDPTQTRKDTDMRLGVTTTVPIADQWSVLLQAEYSRNGSNIRNYDYDNALGMIGLVWRY
jgi:tetratricopeptide (TPR) repeat protein